MAERTTATPAAAPTTAAREPADNNPAPPTGPDGGAKHEDAGRSTATPGSPPLPARHTAATPGPRAARLQELFASSLAHALGRLGWDNFAACYPTVAARAPDALHHVQRQMVERLGELCHKEFDAILQSRDVVAKLNDLETLVSEAARRKAAQRKAAGGEQDEPPTPPHLLPAADILAAHLAPHLAAHQSQLNARLQTTQAHNQKLWTEIQAQRREMAGLLADVERALGDVDGAAGLLAGVADDLAAEAKAVEVEMGGT